jgi:voltage-gated potassium channel
MKSENTEDKIGLLNLIAILLSIYVLLAMLIDSFFKLPTETSLLLNYFDTFICIFFLFEFSVRFYRAGNKLSFMKWGWIDLVSSIPMVDFVRVGRVLRLIRLLRIIRAFRSTNQLVSYIFKNKAQGAFTSVVVLGVLIIIFSSIAILQVETDPNSNIKSAEDAIWWSYVTITTVGYGDKFPVTTEGRIIAAILITCGVGSFGTFAAYVASWFVMEKKTNIQ